MTPEQLLMIERMVLAQTIAIDTDFRFMELGPDGAGTWVNESYSAIIHFDGPHLQSVTIGDMKAAGAIKAELNLHSLQDAAPHMLIALLRRFSGVEPF